MIARPDRRPPAVDGRFYAGEAQALRAEVAECLRGVPTEQRAVRAALVPHAALIYSGACAAAVLGRLALSRVVVILAPNHTGFCDSPGASLWARGTFGTPLGDVPVEAEVAEALIQGCSLVQHDPSAHRFEHAIEVLLPLLQVLVSDLAIVPLVLAWDDWERSEALAAALVEVVRSHPTPTLLLGSTDLTHHEPAALAERKDRLALAAVERLDGAGLLEVCRREGITMCGRAPAAVALEAARRLGASRAEVLDYRHSGWVTGDDREVVSYAGVVTD